MTTRRRFLALLAAPWAQAQGLPAGSDRIVAYRVDAVIVLFSAPIFTRSGVGEGVLYFRKEDSGAGRQLRLAFAAGSRPERARGLNRFGYFSESIRMAENAGAEAQYFGFMTRSDEKNIKEAERALHTGTGGVPVVTICGEARDGRHLSRLTNLELEAGAGWSVWPRCLAAAARSLNTDAPDPSRSSGSSGVTTFLHTLSLLLEQTGSRGETPFLYGRNPRRLVWQRSPDSRAGHEFAARHLVEPGTTVMRFEADIIDESTRGRSRFTLWHDPAARPSLPLRIELQPRSFLRLRLEAVEADTPALRATMMNSFDAWLGPASAVLQAGL